MHHTRNSVRDYSFSSYLKFREILITSAPISTFTAEAVKHSVADMHDFSIALNNTIWKIFHITWRKYSLLMAANGIFKCFWDSILLFAKMLIAGKKSFTALPLYLSWKVNLSLICSLAENSLFSVLECWIICSLAENR